MLLLLSPPPCVLFYSLRMLLALLEPLARPELLKPLESLKPPKLLKLVEAVVMTLMVLRCGVSLLTTHLTVPLLVARPEMLLSISWTSWRQRKPWTCPL